MAIKVSGTEVISDTRTIKVTGADGKYSDLKVAPTTVGSAVSGTVGVSFSQQADGVKSLQIYLSAGLSGAVDWQLQPTTISSGMNKTIIVDTSSVGYDQSFSFPNGTILWPNDTEPDFATARYWAHYITCWDSTTVSILSTSWSSV